MSRNVFNKPEVEIFMKRVLVGDVMTREPVSIKPNSSLLECVKLMVKKRVGSLILSENKKLLGFISNRDILWALTKKSQNDLSKIKASDVSPKKIITISPKATIEEAIQKMKRTKFGRLPVVMGDNLVGMITTKDILNFNPELYPELDELENIREESEKLKRLKRFNEDGFAGDDEGTCEECGNYNRLLVTNGMNVCESCKDLIKEE